MVVNERIRLRRLELGMSQTDLAELVGYKSASAINKIETGQRDVSVAQAFRFAAALHCSLAWLLGQDETAADLLSGLSVDQLDEVAEFIRFVKWRDRREI